MRTVLASVVCASAAFLSVGCVVRVRPAVAVVEPPVAVVEPPVAVVDVQPAIIAVDAPPLVVGAGVFVIDVEPAPVERVYITDIGYPPGCYLYGGFYYYGGHRYERDVFINQVVHVNIQKRLYVDVKVNKQVVEKTKIVQVKEFQKTGGKVVRHVDRPVDHPVAHPEHPDHPVVHPVDHPVGHPVIEKKVVEKKKVVEEKKVVDKKVEPAHPIGPPEKPPLKKPNEHDKEVR